MVQYEVAVLFDQQLEIDLSKATAKIEKIISEAKGKITKTDNWGKRKLAYPIKNQEHAIYVFYTVEMPTQSVAKVDTSLNITDEVIRHLITRPDLKAIEKAEAQKAEKAKKNPSGEDERPNSDDRDKEE